MKQLLLASALATFAVPAFAGDVAVSVRVGEPGFYGQIEIGNMPQPQVVYARPVVIERAPEYAEAAPIYLHVPPGHEKHWKKHCREYNACGRPVFFVRHDWYANEYVPRYREREEREGRGHDEGRHEGKRRDRDDGDREHGDREHGDREHGDREHGDRGRGDRNE
jgi:hypothetical protein